MAETVCGLKLQVIRGPEARELSKVVLYKPADFSYELFVRYRSLDPKQCAEKAALWFGDPSFSLHGPVGSRVEGWLLRVMGTGEVIYLESWPWEFFVYTSSCGETMSRILNWLCAEKSYLRLIKGGKSS